MTYRFDLHARLESVHLVNSPAAVREALRAEVNDPVWFLGRQWQLGEHQGSDAAFPTVVRIDVGETPVTGRSASPEDDPRVTPPEVVIESEPEQWWTVGRRVRVGLALRLKIPAGRRSDPALQLDGLAPPYSHLDGHLDGLRLHRARVELGLSDADFALLGVPAAEPHDDWVPSELAYTAPFSAGPVTVTVPRHDGGNVDWYSVTATSQNLPVTTPPVVRTSYPTRVCIPGGPHPRWWQIDDHRLDPGAVPPDRTHLTALFVIRATSAQTDGWFTAPLVAPTGTLLTVGRVVIDDSMDMTSTAMPALDWAMYHVSGRRANELLLWPAVTHPLAGAIPLDEVDIGVDEDSNLLWAVERRINGTEAVEPDPTSTAEGSTQRGELAVTKTRRYRYDPASAVPTHWHPYVLATSGDRRYLQARLADFEQRPVVPRPGPTSRLLIDAQAGPSAPAHMIFPDGVPRSGLRLDRRFVLGRSTTGEPLLWVQRQRRALRAPPSSSLRFDLLEREYEP
jgi:hypothetical protein